MVCSISGNGAGVKTFLHSNIQIINFTFRIVCTKTAVIVYIHCTDFLVLCFCQILPSVHVQSSNDRSRRAGSPGLILTSRRSSTVSATASPRWRAVSRRARLNCTRVPASRCGMVCVLGTKCILSEEERLSSPVYVELLYGV